MNKNTKVETAKNGQATNKIQPEKVQNDLKKIDDIRKNKSKVPTGKVTLIKETEARKKAREEQYKTFRVNALRRRCSRMGYTEEQTEEFVKKLIEQLKAPKEYSILVMLSPSDGTLFKEALANAKIPYKYHGDTFFSLDGDQNVLAKIREIAPPKAKIHPYAKKMESVLTERPPEKEKKPKNKNVPHSRPKGKNVLKKRYNVAGMSKKNRKNFKAQVKSLRDKWAAEKASKKKGGTTVQLNSKKGSEGLKKAA